MFSDEQRAILWLNAAAKLTSGKINRIAALVSPVALYRDPAPYREQLAPLFTPTQWRELLASRDHLTDRMLGAWESAGIGVLLPREYPRQLREIAGPPSQLYYVGDPKLLSTRMLGVVGTRNCTRYGRDVTVRFVSALSASGLTIVSGMARGIDGIAHRTALSSGGATVGVLGTGIDIEYPADNADLFASMRTNGLLITEYPPGTPGEGFRFPERNRIISGLSEGILIPEASEHSGSLITANFALEQGRTIFVVPSAITNRSGVGSNQLIRTLQGAMVLSPDDVAEALALHAKTPQADALQLSFEEEVVMVALQDRECHFDELLQITSLSISDLNALLTMMEIKGLIHKLEQNHYGV